MCNKISLRSIIFWTIVLLFLLQNLFGIYNFFYLLFNITISNWKFLIAYVFRFHFFFIITVLYFWNIRLILNLPRFVIPNVWNQIQLFQFYTFIKVIEVILPLFFIMECTFRPHLSQIFYPQSFDGIWSLILASPTFFSKT